MYKHSMIALALAALVAGCGGGGAATAPPETDTGTGGEVTAPASLALSQTTASVEAGSTLQLSATALNSAGAAITGAPAATWTTSNAAVALVSATGVVTGVGAGTATVTATVTAAGATRTASALVTVLARTAAPAFTTLTLSPSAGAVAVGGTLALAATPRDAAGQPVAGLPAATFASSGAAVATVSAAGVVTGVAPGTATITATLTAGGVTRSATAGITVTAVAAPPPTGGTSSATVRGLEHAFSPSTVTITTGGTVTWTMVEDEHDITWQGAAPTGGNIPKMDEGESATRTFPVAGTFTYRCARHENHNETGTVIVQAGGGGAAPVFTSVTVAPTAPSVAVGATAQLQATALDQNGRPMSGLPAPSWSTSDAARATVSSSGLATGVAAGTAVITASITSGGVTRTGSATLTVTAGATTPPPPPPSTPSGATVTTPGSSFAPATVTIGVGGTVTWQISGATHNVTFGSAAPPGGSIGDTRSGTNVSRQFTTAGSYDYQCTRHSGMQGRVVVQ